MIGLYPGSFDPPHLGHLDLIARARARCRELIVAVAEHPAKMPLLAAPRRVELLRACCAGMPGVRVDAYRGSTLAYARAHGVEALIRGLRGAADVDHEATMADVHRAQGLETLCLLARPEHARLSSGMVRAMLAAGLDPAPHLPPPVAAALRPG